MLAEPKRKQKISLDPRNKFWSDDTNKFGKRMLEKMGWESGKGLGANLDGNTNHVKVSLKNNTLGVGCSASHDDDWISHQDDFNDILANLNQDHAKDEEEEEVKEAEGEGSIKSLEERSKKSKSRVHYKKFTRGKDLSRYGNVDLACIMGKRSNSEPVTPKTLTPRIQSPYHSDDDEEEKDAGTKEDKTHGFTTITNTTSIQDYFARRMADIKKSRTASSPVVDSENASRGESQEGVHQGEDKEEEARVKKTKKKKKSKRKEKKDSDDSDVAAGAVSAPEAGTGDDLLLLVEGHSSKKSKKRKRRDLVPEDGDCVVLGDKSSSSDEVEILEGSPRKKLNQDRTGNDDVEETLSSSISSGKKSKKKKKKSKNV